ncbi:MAG: beta-phosphoglucomutase family hydrolase [Mycobacteriaceae bacterium]|nr:beta-phosphoglucomutase family hydrolase [Mycobacteriaceae bacterium]
MSTGSESYARPERRGTVESVGRIDRGLEAVIVDMDGVVTDTARVHAAAWKAVFDQALPALGGPTQAPFDVDREYREWVDGRSREDGIRSLLGARGIAVQEGNPGDGADRSTVHGLAARKQELFAAELARNGVRVFSDALDLLEELSAAGVPLALVTASRNSAEILAAAGISALFAVRVDGMDALRRRLAGKPDPAMFVEAACRLGVDPADAVVIEDAAAGVRAAAAGGFGLVVGVDRTDTGEQLAAAGADVVVADLADVSLSMRSGAVGRARAWCGGATTDSGGWNLVYDAFEPDREGTREALCATGNGYAATRGVMPGAVAGSTHYPGAYLAGVYNRVTTTIDGGQVETEHLVNAPDWTFMAVAAVDGSPLRPGVAELLSYQQRLDMRCGVLSRTSRYRDDAGRVTRLSYRQLHSLAEPHLGALELTVEAENWSGAATVRSTINGRVANRNLVADRDLAGLHLDPGRSLALGPDTVLYETSTNQSRVAIAMAARSAVFPAGALTARRLVAGPVDAGHELTVALAAGQPVRVEKVVAITTSRDRAQSTAGSSARDRIATASRFLALLATQTQAWERLWDRFGIRLGADDQVRLALNLNIFHVLQSTATASPDLDAGLPARGLHGEGYRGHIFWDELFVYPVLTLRRPELTRAFLLYRYRRLAAARTAAEAEGLAGAMFPWQSGSDGREETPDLLYNTRNGQWMPDNSHRQRHVGLAVAYSVWQYYQTTADLGFLADYGAVMIVEVARLFASLAVHDPVADRFDICGVMGPDEYHDGPPDAPGSGLRNNAYTNVLAAWVLCRALDTVELLTGHDRGPVGNRVCLEPDELERWEHISRRLRVPFHADGIISQFDGYEDLTEFDWADYRSRYGNIGRLDLILHAESDSTNRYKVAKQPDVLMLFYLLSAEELREVFDRLGYTLAPELIPRTVEYYLARTSHGSTLSRVAHAWVLARSARAGSWSLFTEALDADLGDTQGGATREGVHIGAMAATADMVVRCYGGVETRGDILWLHPVLPDELPSAEFTLSYRGQPLTVSLTHETATLILHPCVAPPIHVRVEGSDRVLSAGDTWQVPLLRTLRNDP